MSVFSAIKAYFAKSVEVTEAAEERATNSTSGITAEEELLLRTALSGGGATNLTSAEALEIPAFSSAIDFVAATIAMLPIKLYKENRSEMTTEEVTDDIRLKLLNDETGDTLNPFEMKKALISDMFTEGKGYIYIERKGNTVKSLRYVESSNVSSQKGIDPIFKVVDIMISGKRYNTWDFIIMTRKTRDGVTGTGLVSEHKLILSAAYNMLRLENNMATCGGSKKGFLESEKQLADEALTKLKRAWNELYSSPDNRAIVLNNGVKFHEGSNSAVDLQLNQNKITNSDQITMLVGLSPKIISGNATEEEYMNAVRTAIVPIVASFQTAINRALLLESEKSDMYFVVDYAELLKGDIRSRYEAYRIGLEANFLQPDEVRYMEDLKPLGLEFIKLGLNDVLYDTKTKEFYTPNTNQHAKMGEKPLQNAEKDDTIQNRDYIQDPETGLMMGSTPEGGIDKSSESGIIDIEVDELVPCLKDNTTGEILATEVRTLSKSEYSHYTASNGWSIDWGNIPDSEEVLGVYLNNDTEPQGLIAIRKEKGGIYLSYASTAPHNNKQLNKGDQRYAGVGGHLFAAAIEESLKAGNATGCIYGYAANEKVLKHYMDKFDALHLPIVHEYQFIIDGEAAQKVLENYNFERR